MLFFKEGFDEADQRRIVLDEKAREEREKAYRKICYAELAVKGVVSFLLGLVVAFLLKTL